MKAIYRGARLHVHARSETADFFNALDRSDRTRILRTLSKLEQGQSTGIGYKYLAPIAGRKVYELKSFQVRIAGYWDDGTLVLHGSPVFL
jgi:hypothetical protein